ncbi:unnamed protein product [Symbiodinium microadriaticum]|nr:unnamed protein product [Symbiodinium microadriaticum]
MKPPKTPILYPTEQPRTGILVKLDEHEDAFLELDAFDARQWVFQKKRHKLKRLLDTEAKDVFLDIVPQNDIIMHWALRVVGPKASRCYEFEADGVIMGKRTALDKGLPISSQKLEGRTERTHREISRWCTQFGADHSYDAAGNNIFGGKNCQDFAVELCTFMGIDKEQLPFRQAEQVKTVLGAGAFVAADAALGTFTEFSAGLRAAASDDGVRVLLSSKYRVEEEKRIPQACKACKLCYPELSKSAFQRGTGLVAAGTGLVAGALDLGIGVAGAAAGAAMSPGVLAAAAAVGVGYASGVITAESIPTFGFESEKPEQSPEATEQSSTCLQLDIERLKGEVGTAEAELRKARAHEVWAEPRLISANDLRQTLMAAFEANVSEVGRDLVTAVSKPLLPETQSLPREPFRHSESAPELNPRPAPATWKDVMERHGCPPEQSISVRMHRRRKKQTRTPAGAPQRCQSPGRTMFDSRKLWFRLYVSNKSRCQGPFGLLLFAARWLQWCRSHKRASYDIRFIAARTVATISFDVLASRLTVVDCRRMRDAYAGCQLATISPPWRGHILEAAARSIYCRQHPGCVVSDPVPGLRCDGSKRSVNQAEYDWMRDGRRVQCKTGQLCWNSSSGCWNVSFHNIKFGLLDELLLVLYTPFRIHLFLHDQRTGIQSTGRKAASRGVRVQYSCAKGMFSCEEATRALVEHVSSGSRHLVTVELASEAAVGQSYSKFCESKSAHMALTAFENHPLGSLTPSARGIFVEQLVLEVDRMLYPQSHFTPQVPNAKHDWFRDHLRVECKHTRLTYSDRGVWTCRFSAIKFQCFDILYLAIDSPDAVFLLHYERDQGRTQCGVETDHVGEQVRIRAPSSIADCREAAHFIVDKLVQGGSKHLATIPFHASGPSQLPATGRADSSSQPTPVILAKGARLTAPWEEPGETMGGLPQTIEGLAWPQEKEDGVLVVIDWGLVAQIQSDLQQRILQFVAHIVSNDYEAIPDDLVRMGFIARDRQNAVAEEAVASSISAVFKSLASGGTATRRIRDVLPALAEIKQNSGNIGQIPASFVYILRCFSILEGHGLCLDEQYRIVDDCYPYLASWTLRAKSPEALPLIRSVLYGRGASAEYPVPDAEQVLALLRGLATRVQQDVTSALREEEPLQNHGRLVDDLRSTLRSLQRARALQDVLLEEAARLTDVLVREALAASAPQFLVASGIPRNEEDKAVLKSLRKLIAALASEVEAVEVDADELRSRASPLSRYLRLLLKQMRARMNDLGALQEAAQVAALLWDVRLFAVALQARFTAALLQRLEQRFSAASRTSRKARKIDRSKP